MTNLRRFGQLCTIFDYFSFKSETLSASFACTFNIWTKSVFIHYTLNIFHHLLPASPSPMSTTNLRPCPTDINTTGTTSTSLHLAVRIFHMTIKLYPYGAKCNNIEIKVFIHLALGEILYLIPGFIISYYC